jgi:anti-sigma-K factor RskA
MTDHGDSMGRAGSYVLGLMDEKERERAERDLENDPSFRDAVVEMAGRMHVFDHAPAAMPPDSLWQEIKDRISELPQMRGAPQAEVRPEPPAAFGRRRSDPKPKPVIAVPAPRAIGTGLHAVPSRRAYMIAAAIVAAFALGYVAGVSSVGERPPAVAAP